MKSKKSCSRECDMEGQSRGTNTIQLPSFTRKPWSSTQSKATQSSENQLLCLQNPTEPRDPGQRTRAAQRRKCRATRKDTKISYLSLKLNVNLQKSQREHWPKSMDPRIWWHLMYIKNYDLGKKYVNQTLSKWKTLPCKRQC